MPAFMLACDIAKAHRRVKVRESDCWYQACRLVPGKVWINKVGTYGVASASYWWCRLAAAVLVRLCHYLLADVVEFELLLYSDDFIFFVMGPTSFSSLGRRWGPLSGGTNSGEVARPSGLAAPSRCGPTGWASARRGQGGLWVGSRTSLRRAWWTSVTLQELAGSLLLSAHSCMLGFRRLATGGRWSSRERVRFYQQRRTFASYSGQTLTPRDRRLSHIWRSTW